MISICPVCKTEIIKYGSIYACDFHCCSYYTYYKDNDRIIATFSINFKKIELLFTKGDSIKGKVGYYIPKTAKIL